MPSLLQLSGILFKMKGHMNRIITSGRTSDHRGSLTISSIIFAFAKRMRSVHVLAILLAVLNLHCAQTPNDASSVTAFDGIWAVTFERPQYSGRNGSIVPAYVRRLRVTVTNGVVHGEKGVRWKQNWYVLAGRIAADGTATLHAHGIPRGGTQPTPSGGYFSETPYDYAVTCKFEDDHGTGHSVTTGNSPVITFTFVKVEVSAAQEGSVSNAR
jgi:hypothetical protein